jgi:hypothetical protein
MNRAITLNIPHQLGRAEARRRIDDGFASLARTLRPAAGVMSKAWTGDRLAFALSAVGQEVRGTVDVEDAVVKLEVLLPGLLAIMADRLKGRLRAQGQLLLEKK